MDYIDKRTKIDKRIESIDRVRFYGKIKYEITLNPGYSFESSGGQVMYCDTPSDIEELKKEIVFCNIKEDEEEIKL